MLQTIKDARALPAIQAERHPWCFVGIDPAFGWFLHSLRGQVWATHRRAAGLSGPDLRRPSHGFMGRSGCRPDSSAQAQSGTNLRTCHVGPIKHARRLPGRTGRSSRRAQLRRDGRPPVWFHSSQSLILGSRNPYLPDDRGNSPDNEARQEYEEKRDDYPERARIRLNDRLRCYSYGSQIEQAGNAQPCENPNPDGLFHSHPLSVASQLPWP